MELTDGSTDEPTKLTLRDLFSCATCGVFVPRQFSTRYRECWHLSCPDCLAENCTACALLEAPPS